MEHPSHSPHSEGAAQTMGPYLPLVPILLLLSTATLATSLPPSNNPFSPQAALLRHWSRHFPAVEMPSVLLSKSSPLNATQLATFSTYLDSHTLSHHLPSFCAAANLFCDVKTRANVTHDLDTDADFESYNNNVFRRYQKDATFGSDSFKNYSVDGNVQHDSFARYADGGNGGSEDFTNYELQTNVAGSDFKKYGADSNGIIGTFTSYSKDSNVQRQDFSAYGQESSAIVQQFTSYAENSNVVRNGFDSYASDGNGASTQFSGYSTSSNVVTNKFTTYDDGGNGGLHQFTGYADSINVGANDFKSYSRDGNGGLLQFTSYGNGGSQPDSTFQSYGKDHNGLSAFFTNYGNSSLPATTQFTEYNKGVSSGNPLVRFTTYGSDVNSSSFKEYFQSSTTFEEYSNASTPSASPSVEPGKFFRQATLALGNPIPFPDIRDKMPPRSFLPKSLVDKLPFSSQKLPDLVQALGAPDLKGMMGRTISECERPATKGETKRCVTSMEAMTEFAASILGPSARVSATESTAGWGEHLVVGKLTARNEGKETRSVSCHQSLFPYLVYYCHMVPKVKVYDVELRRSMDGKKLNQAVAICHLDTTQWSPKHAAFMALGPAPGKIEVCHFIFENDLIWVGRD